MEKINPITEELKEAGSTLGQFPAVTPYRGPVGYFDMFPSIMYRIATEQDLPVSLSGISSPFSVPGGYFDSLSDTLLQKVREADNLPDEKDEISPILSGIGKSMPFSLPDNYFGNLAAKINDNIENEVAVNDADINKPEFLSELLQRAKDKQTYNVPGRYFETLPAKLLAKVSAAGEAKVIESAGTGAKVISGSFGQKWIKYAAAAVVTGLMLTTGYFMVNRKATGDQLVSSTGLQQKTAQTSDEEIINYLESLPASSFDLQPAAGDEIQADAIVDLLAEVSDEELQQYVLTQSDTKEKFN